MDDPLRAQVARRRAAKQQQRERPDEPKAERPYMQQGVRSERRRRQRGPSSVDDLIRERAWEMRSRASRTRLD
jgi:hypothetical protein